MSENARAFMLGAMSLTPRCVQCRRNFDSESDLIKHLKYEHTAARAHDKKVKGTIHHPSYTMPK